MKIDGYEVTEVAPGIKVYERKNALHTTFNPEHPWLHFHYQHSDEEAERLGRLEIELCCHGCGVALWITAPFPTPEDYNVRGKEIYAEFVTNHGTHDAIYIEGDGFVLNSMVKMLKGHPLTQLCPDYRKQVFAIKIGS